VAEPPTVSGFQFREDPVASEVDPADRLGEPIWVPAEWPVRHNPPELLVMLPPHIESGGMANDFRSHYRLRSLSDGELLVVSGHAVAPGTWKTV
jgi:hypothetical protein